MITETITPTSLFENSFQTIWFAEGIGYGITKIPINEELSW